MCCLCKGQDQTMVLRLQSVVISRAIDRALLRICDVPSSTIVRISSMLICPGIYDTRSFILFLTRPRAPTMTGTIVVFIFHILATSISRSLYFDNFSVSLYPTLRSDGTDLSMKKHLFSTYL